MIQEEFGGDKKYGPQSLLAPWEKRFIAWAVPKIPQGITSVHLTLSTVVWSLCIIAGSFLAEHISIHWLWFVSAMIFAHYITDSLDGSLGKYRKEGLIKWGYYMDHFLDYIFLFSVLIGYAFLLPDHLKYLSFFIFALLTAFMVNAFLAFATTNKFRIVHYGIGPTEIRFIFIMINTLLIIFGKTYVAWTLPYLLPLASIGLVVLVYKTQKEIRALDMKKKYGSTAAPEKK